MVTRTKPIDGELLKLKNEIRGYAVEYGLDFFEVIFEVCDYDTINILAAQGGFPSRYPHWRFGMEYDQLSKSYAYGLSKIYEMVINTNPSYAYLLKANHWVDQKIVIGHVYGHSDFFKNNYYFKNTNRNMMDVMANHGTKIRRYMTKYGHEKVESFIDCVLSLENLIDLQQLFETPELDRQRVKREKDLKAQKFEDDRSQALQSYMRSIKKKKMDPKLEDEFRPILNHKLPQRDLMAFLMNYAPIEEWKADIIGILREEAYYFLPQRCTKIMNEGWASYWHSKIMTEKVVKASELLDYADHHAGVMAMSKRNINPYKIGIELYRDIEERWNKGRFGKEFNDCDDMVKKSKWDTGAGLGREKIFEVRKSHNDLTFIDEFFTQDFCERMQLFTHKYNPRTGRNEIDTRDFLAIKQNLLNSLTNFGTPVIDVVDANYNNRGELLLRHTHFGVDLDMKFASDTMKNIFNIWKRPINISTILEDKEVIYCFDGKELKAID